MFEEVLNETVAKDLRCIVGRWISSLDEKESKLVHEAIATHPTNTVFRAAQRYTYLGSQAMWHKHWTGACPCFRKV
jgi:uncharacterized protein HemY